MKLVLNNKKTEIEGHDALSVKALLETTGFASTVIMVKVNNRLVKKADYEGFRVNPGDNVIVVPLVGGG